SSSADFLRLVLLALAVRATCGPVQMAGCDMTSVQQICRLGCPWPPAHTQSVQSIVISRMERATAHPEMAPSQTHGPATYEAFSAGCTSSPFSTLMPLRNGA